MSKRKLVAVAAIVGMLLAGLPAGLALAETPTPTPEPVAVEFTGTVTAVDAETGTLEVQVDIGDGQTASYTVQVPEGMDLTGVAIGDTVEVEGVLTGQGTVSATKVEVQDKDEDDQDGDEDPTPVPTETPTPTPVTSPITPTATLTGTVGLGDKTGYFCRNPEAVHPVGKAIAETYGVTYEEVMAWFCQGRAGFGQIALALQTAETTGDSANTYLERRASGEGWGQIWRDLGLTGKSRKNGRPTSTAEPTSEAQPTDEAQPTATATPASGGAARGTQTEIKPGQSGNAGKPNATMQPNKPNQGQGADKKPTITSARDPKPQNAGQAPQTRPTQASKPPKNTGQPVNPGQGKGSSRR